MERDPHVYHIKQLPSKDGIFMETQDHIAFTEYILSQDDSNYDYELTQLITDHEFYSFEYEEVV
jgi:hypothetical protein